MQSCSIWGIRRKPPYGKNCTCSKPPKHHLGCRWRSLPEVIALYDWEGDLPAAIGAGVRGILPDTSTESELCAAMVAIAKGWLVLPPTAIELFDRREKSATPAPQILTPREIEVLVQIGAGLRNKALAKPLLWRIAQNLHISDHTVKFHVSSIFQKLDVSTRTEAVTAGIEIGLILL